MMKRNARLGLFAFVVLLTLGTTHSGALESSEIIDKIWIHRIGKWIYPPPDPDEKQNYRTSSATLIRFSANHELSLIRCWIFEDKGRLSISGGDPQMIYLGSWSDGKDGIVTKLRLVYEMPRAIGRTYPGPQEEATTRIVGRKIEFNGDRFVEAKTLDVEIYEEFIEPERAKLKLLDDASDP